MSNKEGKRTGKFSGPLLIKRKLNMISEKSEALLYVFYAIQKQLAFNKHANKNFTLFYQPHAVV
jgi:hypothetical protein